MPPRISVGPVVGKVTATTARVLVEADRAAAGVTCTLRAGGAGGHAVTSGPLDLATGRPRAFAFAGLRPETEYAIEIASLRWDGSGSLRTLAAPSVSMNLGLVSCNFTPRRGDTDLWADLRNRFVAPGHLDVLVHMGDQVYGDSAFLDSLATLRGRAAPTRTQERNILEQYRDLYRAAWGGHEATRDVLAHVSNLTIWDDHEIRDDWGSRARDSDPASPEHCVGKLARRVYREYQRQLWDDVDDAVAPAGTEHHLHVWDGIAVLFLDQRGARSFETDPELPYLGRRQWAEVEQALAPRGALDTVRALLVVTSVPLVYLGPALSARGRYVIDDIEDHWSWGPYQTEQLQLIRRLRTWKERGGGDREVLVVGGDVHVGGYTEIRHDGKPIFRQLISSPVTNRPPGWALFRGLEELLEAEQQLAHGYSFEHSNCTNRRNYGIVVARIPAGAGAPTLDGSLVVAPF